MSGPTTQSGVIKRLKGGVYETLRAVSPSLLQIISKRARYASDNWRYRAKLIRACPDYSSFAPVINAGQISNGVQVMHNGIKVLVGSYYGSGASSLLTKTKGVHEPQEERVFEEILKLVKPGSSMIELGAYWSFYSMWFSNSVLGARPFLVEPMEANLEYGKKNFELNGMKGDFTQAYVGRESTLSSDGIRVICVDDFVLEKSIDRVAILHCDIQGHELEMLRGAQRTIQQRRVDYYFISTHSEEIHVECEAFLRRLGINILTSISMAESYSIDGILVGVDPGAARPAVLNISRRNQAR